MGKKGDKKRGQATFFPSGLINQAPTTKWVW